MKAEEINEKLLTIRANISPLLYIELIEIINSFKIKTYPSSEVPERDGSKIRPIIIIWPNGYFERGSIFKNKWVNSNIEEITDLNFRWYYPPVKVEEAFK